jgi:3-deoxy-D-manno-octulosonic-acid transferase
MAAVIFGLYNLILETAFLLFYPLIWLICLGKHYTDSLKPQGSNSEGGILLHAASVGEVNAVKPLLVSLKQKYPDKKIVITTNTVTGLKAAKAIHQQSFLAVMDIRHLRRKQLAIVNPSLIIIMETEIWPNLLHEAARQNIAVVFVNARLSEKSLQNYARIKRMLRYLQKPIRCIISQSDADSGRFKGIFAVPVHTAGNLKFALKLPEYDFASTRRRLGFAEKDFIICFGSSRPGEEGMLKAILPELQSKIERLKFIIAPRHPKRTNEVAAVFPEATLYTQVDNNGSGGGDVLIVDTIGHLNECYSVCDIAIVGGSFFNFGGHNPLEPAYYGKPIIIGEYNQSCRESVKALAGESAILVSNESELADNIIDLHGNPEKRLSMGRRAQKCLERYAEALNRHMELLERWIS